MILLSRVGGWRADQLRNGIRAVHLVKRALAGLGQGVRVRRVCAVRAPVVRRGVLHSHILHQSRLRHRLCLQVWKVVHHHLEIVHELLKIHSLRQHVWVASKEVWIHVHVHWVLAMLHDWVQLRIHVVLLGLRHFGHALNLLERLLTAFYFCEIRSFAGSRL